MSIEKLGITPGPWGMINYPVKNERLHSQIGPMIINNNISMSEQDMLVTHAAPEMLEVLIETAEYQELSHGGVDCIIQDAIESATGRTWEEVRSIVYESV